MPRNKLPKMLLAKARLAIRLEQRSRFNRLKRYKKIAYDSQMFEEILSAGEREAALSGFSGVAMSHVSEHPQA